MSRYRLPVTVAQEVRRRILALPVVWRSRVLSIMALYGINALGVFLVCVLSAFIIPMPVPMTRDLIAANALLLTFVLPLLALWGHLCAHYLNRPMLRWLQAGVPPTDEDKRWLIAIPRRTFIYHAGGWALGLAIVSVFNGQRDGWELAAAIAQVVSIAGICASSLAYLLAERLLRPLAATSLTDGFPEDTHIRTVASRIMSAWWLGTAAPVVGLITVGWRLLADEGDIGVDRIARTIIVLALISLVVGGGMIMLAARASSDPVRQLRRALVRVEHGDLEVKLPIYDGTDIGLLQAGFNEMANGLRERERMRDLFDRHVGGDVAQAALEGGVRLGGEARDAGILFVDVIGSTTLATEREPAEVVALLNRFFEIVINVVSDHGGWINKFEGDAALAVWGVPLEIDDVDARLLATARELSTRLRDELPEVPAGIGITSGKVVAGNVGVAERYEFTVIGDPVIEASRLSEVAKKFSGRVVANAALLDSAGEEAGAWVRKSAVRARGRTHETAIAVLRD